MQTTNHIPFSQLQDLVKDLVDSAEIHSVSAQHHIKYISMVNKSLKPFGIGFQSADNRYWELKTLEV